MIAVLIAMTAVAAAALVAGHQREMTPARVAASARRR